MSQVQKNDSLLLILSAIQNRECFPLLEVKDDQDKITLINDTRIVDDFFSELSKNPDSEHCKTLARKNKEKTLMQVWYSSSIPGFYDSDYDIFDDFHSSPFFVVPSVRRHYYSNTYGSSWSSGSRSSFSWSSGGPTIRRLYYREFI